MAALGRADSAARTTMSSGRASFDAVSGSEARGSTLTRARARAWSVARLRTIRNRYHLARSASSKRGARSRARISAVWARSSASVSLRVSQRA